MTVIKALAECEKSCEDAVRQAVMEERMAVCGVESIYLENLEATMENGRIGKCRVNASISFLLGG